MRGVTNTDELAITGHRPTSTGLATTATLVTLSAGQHLYRVATMVTTLVTGTSTVGAMSWLASNAGKNTSCTPFKGYSW